MPLQAYVLIQAEPRRAGDVAAETRGLPGVISCDALAGPYDGIALVDVANLEELGQVVVSRIQLIDGVTRTLTCPIVHF